MEDDLVARRIGLDALGDEAVERERLVRRARHQRLIDIADEPLRRRQGLDVVRIQAVEGAEIGEIERAALGRLRVHVRQVVEVGRQGRLAVHRNRARRRTDGRRRSRAGPRARIASAAPRRERIVRPIIAALLSSGVGGFPMKGAPLAELAPVGRLLPAAQWLKGRNCYWNVASNMERGAPIRSAFAAPCVMRSPGGSPTPIAGRLAVFWRRAKRKTIPFNSSKGRLMRFQVMRAERSGPRNERRARWRSACAAAQPAQPAVPGAPGAQRRSRRRRRRSIWCRRSRNGPNSAPNSLPMARKLAPRCATSRPRPISRR